MKIILLSLLLLFLVTPQENLYPISQCLGDCVLCSLDEPSLCSGKEFLQCAKGYDGPGCVLKPSFANEIVLMDKNKQRGTAGNWISDDTIQCHYINSRKQNISVYILGIYSEFKHNEVTVTVEPFYQNFVSSFNLIRGSWTPFSDLLRVAVSDQEENIILEYFIDFTRRDEITAEKDPLVCNNEHLISQKYEIQGAIDPKEHQTLTFKFEGMMFSEAIWGLTNVKIAFGCSNFLLFNEAMCLNCQTGYHPIKDIQENVIGCQPCQLSCQVCSTKKICQKCVDGFSLSAGQCVSKMISRIFIPQQKLLICSNKSYKISNSSGKQQKIILDIKSIPLHKKLNLIFNIAYAPKKTSENNELSVFVDGSKQMQISSLLQNNERKPKAICEGFGADKYYQIHKVVLSSINHKMDHVKIQIVGKGDMKFGVQSVLYQYQQDIQQKPKQNEEANKIDEKASKPGEVDNQKQHNNKDVVEDNSDRPQQANKKQQVEQKKQPSQNQQLTQNQQGTKEKQSGQKSQQQEQSEQSEKPKQQNIDSPNQESIQPANDNSNSKNKQGQQNERVPRAEQTNKGNIGESKEQKLEQNPIQEDDSTNDDSKNKAEVSDKQQEEISRKQRHAQHEKPTQQQAPHPQRQAPTGEPKENLEQQKEQESTENTQNKQRASEKQLSLIAESISKLQKNKWSIEVGLKLGRELIISLYYPMTLQHFPYFSAVLTKNNFTIIPQIIDVSKQEQQLHFDLHRSLLDQNIEIYMLEKPPLRRTLQESQQTHLLGTVHVRRFDHLTQQQWNSVNSFSSFFQALSWITIILTIIFTFLGNSVVTQSFSLLLQIIFLHTYIFSEYLPINFKFVIGGLYRMQNLNYLHKELAEKIQSWLMGNVIQFSPMKFTNYSKDVNFSRAIYPCLIINGLYLLWFLINNLVKYKLQPYHDNDDQKDRAPKIKLFFIQIAERVMNFWHQVWQYQYIVFMWAGFTQLHNLVYPQGANRSAAPNLILCGICLLMGLILPICTFFYIRSRYFRIDYFEYNYWYQNIFYLQLPPCSIPTGHHRFNILARNVRYIGLILSFSFLGDYPIQALSLLIFNHIIYTLYLKMTKIEIKKIILVFSVLENVFLILLAVGMIAAFGLSDVLSTTNYMAIGYVLITLVVLTTAVGLAKTGYLCFKKFNDTIGKKERSSISQDEARE